MYSFLNDYSEGACKEIMQALNDTNLEQTSGYGTDQYSDLARASIRKHLENADCDIHFLGAGTLTNLITISAVLRTYQGVISASSGHINTHESGAIEATGHKVLTIPSTDGKIYPKEINALMNQHYDDANREHTVQPAMVYISNPTEVGTIYSKYELTELSTLCKKWDIPLFIDGARLGCALTSKFNDVTLKDIAKLSDVFYIGGTKMGALFGEALVITNPKYKKDLRYHIKQHGGMVAKGRLLGIQFNTLFTDNLYLKLATHANEMAQKLASGIKELNFQFLTDTVSNQVFPIFPITLIDKLNEKFVVALWEHHTETTDVVRLCTSWATDENQVNNFLDLLRDLVR